MGGASHRPRRGREGARSGGAACSCGRLGGRGPGRRSARVTKPPTSKADKHDGREQPTGRRRAVHLGRRRPRGGGGDQHRAPGDGLDGAGEPDVARPDLALGVSEAGRRRSARRSGERPIGARAHGERLGQRRAAVCRHGPQRLRGADVRGRQPACPPCLGPAGVRGAERRSRLDAGAVQRVEHPRQHQSEAEIRRGDERRRAAERNRGDRRRAVRRGERVTHRRHARDAQDGVAARQHRHVERLVVAASHQPSVPPGRVPGQLDRARSTPEVLGPRTQARGHERRVVRRPHRQDHAVTQRG